MKLKLPEKIDRKKTLAIVPFLFTYLNAIFGFLSILKALDDEYISAACYILLAALMDSVDGRLARAFNSVSGMGMELDSLCDAISFCLAPTVLLYCWFPGFVGYFSQAVLVFYLCAGLYRLARFNTTQEKQHLYFRGLPTPLAAAFIASVVLSVHALPLMLYKIIVLPLIMCIALLMISPISFYSFKSVRITTFYDYCLLSIGILVIALSVVWGWPLLLFVIASYILAHVLRGIVQLF